MRVAGRFISWNLQNKNYCPRKNYLHRVPTLWVLVAGFKTEGELVLLEEAVRSDLCSASPSETAHRAWPATFSLRQPHIVSGRVCIFDVYLKLTERLFCFSSGFYLGISPFGQRSLLVGDPRAALLSEPCADHHSFDSFASRREPAVASDGPCAGVNN